MLEKIKILILEDVLTDLQLALSELKQENLLFDYLHVENEHDFANGLKVYKPDIILSDYNLPQFDGMAALKLTKEISPDTPFIIVTGSINEETAVACIKGGAEDYIVKGHYRRLGSAVLSAIDKARTKSQKELAQKQLQESEEQFRSIFEHAAVGIIYAGLDGKFLKVNNRFCEITGYSTEEAAKLYLVELMHPDDADTDFKLLNNVVEKKIKKFNVDRRCIYKDKSVGWVNLSVSLIRDSSDNPLYFIGVIKDISDKVEAERRQNLLANILSILNRPNEWQQLILDILKQLKNFTQIDAIAIRLKKGEGYPYFESIGYDKEFIEADPDGEITQRDEDKPQLGTLYQMVISGNIDSSQPYFTDGGSFWTNSIKELIKKNPDQKLFDLLQNQYNQFQFQSTALIPLHSGEDIIGLLQLNDKRKDIFNANMIDYFEEVGSTIGIAFKRSESEKEIKESESRFRNLFENTPVSIWEEDFSEVKKYLQGIEDINKKDVEEYFGAHPEIIGKCMSLVKVINVNREAVKLHKAKNKDDLLANYAKTFTEDSYTIFRKELTAIVQGANEMQSEAIVQTLDKERLNVSISWVAAPGHEESLSKVLVTIVDITERKKVEQALRESEERFRGLFENATVGIYRTTPAGEVLIANPCLVAMLGYSSQEDLINNRKATSGYLHPDARGRFLKILEMEGTVYGFEEEWIKRDGTILWIRESAKAIKDSAGKTLYYEGIIEDITNIKEAELALIKAKEGAERSDRLKTEFLAQMSHEIRTPINVMLNFVDLIKEDIENENYADIFESFNHIHVGGNRIIRTIDLILNMAEVQTGSFEPNLIGIDICADVLSHLDNEFRYSARSKQLEINFHKNTDETKIIADKYSVHQIFSNLVDNAIKYTVKGKIDITILRNSNGELIVEVTDTGIGISKEFLPKLFEPFAQEEQGYTRRFEGNGLGLALVKKYCELNNATITVESEKDTGSTFFVTFHKK